RFRFGMVGPPSGVSLCDAGGVMDRENSEVHASQLGGCLTRLFWMGIGNLMLVLVAVNIVQRRAGFAFSGLDVLFWGTVVALLAVRWVDIQFLQGQTADSRPATMADWRRYGLLVSSVSLIVWIVAHWMS
ncbi:MAG: hypothetical protein ABFC54_05000, partial [Thermoguttaceae bacterium]